MGVAKRYALSQKRNNINTHPTAKVQHLHSYSYLWKQSGRFCSDCRIMSISWCFQMVQRISNIIKIQLFICCITTTFKRIFQCACIEYLLLLNMLWRTNVDKIKFQTWSGFKGIVAEVYFPSVSKIIKQVFWYSSSTISYKLFYWVLNFAVDKA